MKALSPVARNAKGQKFVLTTGRTWNDMPFKFYVMTLKTNYEHGRDHTRWVVAFESLVRAEAEAYLAKRIAR